MDERRDQIPRSRFDAEHERVWLLLPWFVNGSMHDAEEVRVHVGECLVCRREVQALRVLSDAVRAPAAAPRCEDALRRLNARIDHRRGHRSPTPWAAAAVLALVCGLVVNLLGNTQASIAWLRNTGLSMMSQSHVAEGGPGALRAHLVFYDNITERELRALLLSVGAELIEGPTRYGVYTIAFERAAGPLDAAEALSQLRHSRRVVFAEPLIANSVSDLADW